MRTSHAATGTVAGDNDEAIDMIGVITAKGSPIGTVSCLVVLSLHAARWLAAAEAADDLSCFGVGPPSLAMTEGPLLVGRGGDRTMRGPGQRLSH